MNRNPIYTPLVYLDSCVFLSYLSEGKNSPPNGYKTATYALILTYNQKIHVVISKYTDMEMKDGHPDHSVKCSDFLKMIGVWRIDSDRVDYERIKISKRLLSKFNLGKMDANHLAFAAATKCMYFCTFDKGILKFKDALEEKLNMAIISDSSEFPMIHHSKNTRASRKTGQV